ncbi:MAG: hypothetical protein HYV40_01960 [Candidatus Levybacteria bacterium]|nr:hypothetical protein [Candidatus Levybacteria bacterium]
MAKGKTKPSDWSRLDQIALDIEFLLISVVQGVALAALAGAAVQPIESLSWQYIPYAVTAFLVVLIFWSGAIIHALSFIDWPLDLMHSFLYFLASFVEVMAFTHIENPLLWFIFILGFQLVSAILYRYDLTLIKKHEVSFATPKARSALYAHTLSQQEKEMSTYVPLAILYSSIAIASIYFFPSLFLEKGYHLLFILGQLLFSLFFLKNSMASFKKRSMLLEASSK